MSTLSFLKGHEIEFLNGEWVFSDNKKPTVLEYKSRSCKKCGKHSTKEGHDDCLKILPGIKNACCGHSIEKYAYIQFLDGKSIHGKDAVIVINILKKYKTVN